MDFSGSCENPPIGSIYHLYTTYILPSGGLYAIYHLLGEPETTIDIKQPTNYSYDHFQPDHPNGYTP